MTREGNGVSDADLHAYADGLLTGERAARVEQYLAAHPDKAQEIEDWRTQNSAMKALYGHVAKEPVPERLDPHRIAAEAKAGPGLRGVRRAAAAALLVFAVGGFAGWMARDMLAAPPIAAAEPMVRQAMAAHVLYAAEVRHPVEVGGGEEAHLVRWLSARLDQPVTAPDLKAHGFKLMGGRLLPASYGPAAQFMYEDGSGQRVTLFLTRHKDSNSAAFRFASHEKTNAFYWLDRTTNYALVGAVSRDQLRRLAQEVYDQLSL